MTPSGWHDDARNRDAGHDEMQIAVFDHLQDKPTVRGMDGYEDRIGIYFESPFYVRGRIVAWGDIVELWEKKPQYETAKKRRYVVWAIKPKIYSVGAVIRQCRSLVDVIESSQKARRTRGSSRNLFYDDPIVLPVVRSDDPKLSMLRHVCSAMAWDGERLS